MRRRNQYAVSQDLPFIPGLEVAATVAEAGEGVEGVAVGDRVVALLGWAPTQSTPTPLSGA